MPRLFISVDLPDDIKKALSALGQGLPGVRWLRPEHLHLTIRFIGEVDEVVFATIREGLTGEGLAPFACHLQGVGYFPPRGRPRVIWAGVHAEAGLFALQARVESDLRRIGLPPEEKKFVPHITLARPKDLQPAAADKYLNTHHLFQSSSFSIQSFHLYSSVLTAKGAIHTLEQSYGLP